ncbi:MAG: alpha-glucosidase [Pseudomonadota bacterium]
MFVSPLSPSASTRRQLGGNPDWWRGAVIYQIYPRSYLDVNADGIGDLAGITSRLDYIKSLNVDAIWISPFFVSPMDDFGYDVADYKNVDPMFGSLEDFDALLAAAHDRGLRVLIDLVISHTSDRHPWFRESRADAANPKADWYVWANAKPDGTPPNNWLSIFGGSAWEWESRRQQYYLHNFLASQPDLNFQNPIVQTAVLDAAQFWLERGVDGFRLDTVNMYFHDAELRDNPPLEPGQHVNGIPELNPYSRQQPIYNITRPDNLVFLEKLRALMDKYPATTTVGEVGAVLNMYETLADYTEEGKRLHMAYSFDFLERTYSADFIKSVGERMQSNRNSWPSWAFSNHDVERVLTRWQLGMDQDRASVLLIALLTCLRGTPCIYQGEELGLTEAIVPYEQLQDPYGVRFWPEFKGRDGCRTPMPWNPAAPNGGFSETKPWLPVPPEHIARAVSVQEANDTMPLNHVRRFLGWRKDQAPLLDGSMNFHDTQGEVVAFTRDTDGERILCLFNLGDTSASFDTEPFGPINPIGGHGFGGQLAGNDASLDPFDAFFARYG